MKKFIIMLALSLATVVIPSANAGVKKIGTINGCDIYRVKTMGIFCPSTTSVVVVNTNRPGTVEAVLVTASGTSALGTVSSPAATAAAAYLLKPSTTEVNQQGGGATAGANNQNVNGGSTSTVVNSNSNTANGGAGGNGGNGGSGNFVPPGHVNNPSGNH